MTHRPLTHAGFDTPEHRCMDLLLAAHAERTPDAAAILAPGRLPLTYGHLYQQVRDISQALSAMGVDRHDRVALALPNGPEMAVACVAITSSAICMPLNPAYNAQECDRYFARLRPKALVIQAGIDTPGLTVALKYGLSIFELSPAVEAAAGIFTLTGEAAAPLTYRAPSAPEDIALILHTTGSTSRPKIVPLTQANVCAAAYNLRVAFALINSDRCLNVMPLFHSHGLKGGLFASLAAGASVVCPTDFSVTAFFAWMMAFRPTWYTAVPVIHQAILEQASSHPLSVASSSLRFIRSSSAHLSPQIRDGLENVFNAPVIESYGTTEASIVTCNPLPPRPRKPGSVGVAAGPEVAIMDAAGNLLPTGAIGEIVARGSGIMRGYENDPEANKHAFTKGWYRTGDQGYVDDDGYLFITGRFKEMINRGGEKVAPQEVDDVLAEHPAVAQAVTFPVPHPRLGEDIAAAVVLHQNSIATGNDIRQFATTRLTEVKVPRQIYIVQAIPNIANGKPQRAGLAEYFGLSASRQTSFTQQVTDMMPQTLMEELVAGLWGQVLNSDRVGIHDNFFALGGDSILATQIISRIREAMRIEIPFSQFFDQPTVAGMVRNIEAAYRSDQNAPMSPITPVPRSRVLPLAVAQEQLWGLDRALGDSSLFNTFFALSLTGTLDMATMQRSLNRMIQRHEALRTTVIIAEGRPVQSIAPTLTLSLTVTELCTATEGKRQKTLWQLASQEAQRPFNLRQGPLVHARLLRLSEQEHVLLVTMHHIICDGWSTGIFVRELGSIYNAFAMGEQPSLPPLPVQYADFACWQRQWRQTQAKNVQLAYWKRQLRSPLPILRLPAGHPRTRGLSFRTASQTLVLPRALSDALADLNCRQGNTLFMTLLATFTILLYCYTGQEDLVVATLVANRNRREIEGLIGLFVNTLLLRTDLRGNPTLRNVLQRVRDVTLEAYAHQDLPFEDLVETLEHQPGVERADLCRVMLILQNILPRSMEGPKLTLKLLEPPENIRESGLTVTTFDLILLFRETTQGLKGSCIYKTQLFDAASIKRLWRDFQHILECIVAQPEQTLLTFGLPRYMQD